MDLMGAGLDWGVDELVKVIRNPGNSLKPVITFCALLDSFSKWKKGFPTWWQLELQGMGIPPFSFDLNGNGS
jgi:hypothetical protein